MPDASTGELVLTVWLDGKWRIWPANAEYGTEGDEYFVVSITVAELQAAIEQALLLGAVGVA